MTSDLLPKKSIGVVCYPVWVWESTLVSLTSLQVMVAGKGSTSPLSTLCGF